MTNKGIIVEDKALGESVACIDARENDNDGNARVIQQFAEVTSPASGIQGTESGTPLRILDFGTSGSKGSPGQGDEGYLHSTEIEAGITNNLLDVSDASAFVLHFVIDYSAAHASAPFIQCVPLAFNDAGTEVTFCFPPALLRAPYRDFYIGALSNPLFIEEQVVSTDDFNVYRSSGILSYVSVPLVYPTYGLKNVGVSLRAHEANALIVDIYGFKLSGAAADAALNNAVHQQRMLSTACLPGSG